MFSIIIEKDNYLYYPKVYIFSTKIKNVCASIEIILGTIIFIPIV